MHTEKILVHMFTVKSRFNSITLVFINGYAPPKIFSKFLQIKQDGVLLQL